MTKFKRFATIYVMAWVLILSIAATATVMVKASAVSAEKAPKERKHSIQVSVPAVDLSDFSKQTSTEAKAEQAIAEDPWVPDQTDVVALARVLYGECRGVHSTAEKSAVAWCVLNRVDCSRFPDTITGVLEAPHQFAYSIYNPVVPELEELAADVLTRWHAEKTGSEDVGRVLPSTYLYFFGDGQRNHFTEEYRGSTTWDWSLPDPYEN